MNKVFQKFILLATINLITLTAECSAPKSNPQHKFPKSETIDEIIQREHDNDDTLTSLFYTLSRAAFPPKDTPEKEYANKPPKTNPPVINHQ